MLAFTIHKRGLCPKCGYPREVCRSQDGFTAQRDVCHASAAVEEAQEQARKDNDPDHGVMWVPVFDEQPAGSTEAKPPPGMFD